MLKDRGNADARSLMDLVNRAVGEIPAGIEVTELLEIFVFLALTRVHHDDWDLFDRQLETIAQELARILTPGENFLCPIKGRARSGRDVRRTLYDVTSRTGHMAAALHFV